MLKLTVTNLNPENSVLKNNLIHLAVSAANTLINTFFLGMVVYIIWNSILVKHAPALQLTEMTISASWLLGLALSAGTQLLSGIFNEDVLDQHQAATDAILESLERNNELLEAGVDTLEDIAEPVGVNLCCDGPLTIASEDVKITATETHGTVQILTEDSKSAQ